MKYSFIKSWGVYAGDLALESSDGLARGNGQSYGDSALNSLISFQAKNSSFGLDSQTGILSAKSGATLGEILATILPLGWILPVIPGSSQVTIGGAIASDIHGKNHLKEGSFSRHVISLKLDISGVHYMVYPEESLFQATCGGMGLTGVILEASIQLKKLKHLGWEKRERICNSLEELFDQLQRSRTEYVNAWVDGFELNRGVLTEIEQSSQKTRPFDLNRPPIAWTFDVWNDVSQKIFNSAYFYYKKNVGENDGVDIARELFPLERFLSWNKLCGEKGLVQLHFVVPQADQCLALIRSLLNQPVRPLLVSLKKFGPGNGHPLSFAMEGVGAALDFKNTPEARALIHKLTDAIVGFHGKVYLTKDSQMTESQFKNMYPDWERFQRIRAEVKALGKYHSRQSKRLGLD